MRATRTYAAAAGTEWESEKGVSGCASLADFVFFESDYGAAQIGVCVAAGLISSTATPCVVGNSRPSWATCLAVCSLKCLLRAMHAAVEATNVISGPQWRIWKPSNESAVSRVALYRT